MHRAMPAFLRLVAAIVGAVAALVITAAIVMAVEGPGDTVITALEVVAVAIVLLAGATWAGRRWRRLPDLLLVAFVVILTLGFAAWLRPPLHGGYGSRNIRPTTAASIEERYELAGGKLRIDLTDAPLGSRTRTVHAALSVGSLVIVGPDDAAVALDAHVGGGELCAFDLRDQGTDIARRITTPTDPSPALRLHARLGIGRLVVVRASQSGMECASSNFVPTTPTTPPPTTAPPPPATGLLGLSASEHRDARKPA
jgi:hypothetical protein